MLLISVIDSAQSQFGPRSGILVKWLGKPKSWCDQTGNLFRIGEKLKTLALTLSLGLVAAPIALAKEPDPAKDNPIMRLLDLILPDELENLRKFGTPDQYEMPEVLPNGDILIRRKPQPLPPPRDGEIDL